MGSFSVMSGIEQSSLVTHVQHWDDSSKQQTRKKENDHPLGPRFYLDNELDKASLGILPESKCLEKNSCIINMPAKDHISVEHSHVPCVRTGSTNMGKLSNCHLSM